MTSLYVQCRCGDLAEISGGDIGLRQEGCRFRNCSELKDKILDVALNLFIRILAILYAVGLFRSRVHRQT